MLKSQRLRKKSVILGLLVRMHRILVMRILAQLQESRQSVFSPKTVHVVRTSFVLLSSKKIIVDFLMGLEDGFVLLV